MLSHSRGSVYRVRNDYSYTLKSDKVAQKTKGTVKLSFCFETASSMAATSVAAR